MTRKTASPALPDTPIPTMLTANGCGSRMGTWQPTELFTGPKPTSPERRPARWSRTSRWKHNLCRSPPGVRSPDRGPVCTASLFFLGQPRLGKLINHMRHCGLFYRPGLRLWHGIWLRMICCSSAHLFFSPSKVCHKAHAARSGFPQCRQCISDRAVIEPQAGHMVCDLYLATCIRGIRIR